MAWLRQFDPSYTNEKHLNKNVTERHYELKARLEMNEMESLSACSWGGGGGGGSNDGAQWDRTANLLPDPLLLWWFFGGPLLRTHSKKRESRGR